MKKIYILFTAVFICLIPIAAQAYMGLCCAKCGGNMPLNIVGGGVPETRELRLKLQPSFMKMDGLRDGTGSAGEGALLGGMPPAFMAVPTEMDMSMINLAVGYSFTDDFFGGVMFMRQKKSMKMRFGDMMRKSSGQDGFTMESEGLADTMLMAKYRLSTDDPLVPTKQVSLFTGLSLPTGSIDERNSKHPLAAEPLPYGMQLGSGTFDPTIGILYQGSLSPLWWGTNLLYTERLYDNKHGYRLGPELRLDLYGLFQVRHDTVLELQLNGSHLGEIEGEMDDAAGGIVAKSAKTSSGFTTPLWDPDNYGGTKVQPDGRATVAAPAASYTEPAVRRAGIPGA